MLDLLKVSSPPGDGGTWRPLELTVVARSEVVPWRYPARRELQFGEWLRHDILSGTFEPAVLDHDLAILLTKARQHSLALLGPSAATFFEPVPKEHFSKALFDTIAQWNAESDWKGDERGTVAKLAMRQPFVLFKGLTFQKLCLPGAFRPGDHHNKMLRPGLCVVHASPQYL